MIWVVVSNTNRCLIFHYDKKMHHLTLAKEMLHPPSKLKWVDLISDAQGRYKTNVGSGGSFSAHAHENPREVEFEQFAREVGKELDEGRRNNAYDNIILITSPHMSGLIHKHLNPHVKAFMLPDIHKDYSHLTGNELITVVKEELRGF